MGAVISSMMARACVFNQNNGRMATAGNHGDFKGCRIDYNKSASIVRFTSDEVLVGISDTLYFYFLFFYLML